VIPGINDAHYHLGVAPDDLPIHENDPKWQTHRFRATYATRLLQGKVYRADQRGSELLDPSNYPRAVTAEKPLSGHRGWSRVSPLIRPAACGI
jgi:imidazolonepropionase-like amidohydrolase